jgi:hypothetical protein
MHMADWVAKLDDFIRLSDREILSHAGRVAHQDAEQHAFAQYQQFDDQRRQIADAGDTSDFDQEVKRLTEQIPPPKPRNPKKKSDRPKGRDDE